MTRRVDDAAYLGLALGILTTAICIRAAAELRRIASKRVAARQQGRATR
jgi:hypothetical protein